MSKPDSTGESLESILASIRKSLSEQSTDVLEEEARPAEAEGDAKSAAPRKDGLAQRLAATDAPETEEPQVEVATAEDVPGLVVEPPPATPPPATPAATVAERKDPLWFLNRRGEAAAKGGGQPAAANAPQPAAVGRAPAAEPKAARAGVVRGPLPPFFGSSAEAAKVEVVPAEPIASGVGVMLPPPMVTLGGAQRVPADAEGAARNGKTDAHFGEAAADGKAALDGAHHHIHALEAMVSEMLRPMLRGWLEENMPRLVSAALKDELARLAERDSKKP